MQKKMKKVNQVIKIVLAISLVYGCDTLEQDAIPDEQKTLQFQENVTTLSNTSVIFDLRKHFKTAGEGTFRAKTHPSRGNLSFMAQHFLKYTPNSSFTSGQDFFVVEAVGPNQFIMALDTVNITVVSDTSDIPCFNGALSDYVTTSVNKPVTFNVIKNDGYCKDETTGAVVDIIYAPLHGQLSLIDLFVYQYIPNTDFVGIDTVIYSLELIDLTGNSHFSSAVVSINVSGGQDSVSLPCNLRANDDHFFLSGPDSTYYNPGDTAVFNVLANDEVCDINSLETLVSDKNASEGDAFFIDNALNYVPKPEFTGTDTVNYSICESSETLKCSEAQVLITIN